MPSSKILIVDDDPSACELLKEKLKEFEYDVETYLDGQSAISYIESRKASIDLVISDLKMPGMDGLELFKRIKRIYPDLPVIIVTAYATVDSAIEVMREGAYDYITKPINFDKMEVVIKNALLQHKLQKEVNALKEEVNNKYAFGNIIGKTDKMMNILKQIEIVANLDVPVLIKGEKGTGKEAIAKAIHYNGIRKDNPFITVNCLNLPSSLLEIELFGDEKNNIIGKVELASNGTIFLDEIAQLPPTIQNKLIELIEEKTFEQIGGHKKIRSYPRILTATRTIEENDITKNIRNDLYCLLKTVTIEVPTLRERKEDIPLLTEHFINLFNKQYKRDIISVSPDVLNVFMEYGWYGNVMELKNIIQQAVIGCRGNVIMLSDLPIELRRLSGSEKFSLIDIPDDGISLPDVEKELIIKALNKTNWNQSKTAELLGISRKMLRTRIERYKLLKSKRAYNKSKKRKKHEKDNNT